MRPRHKKESRKDRRMKIQPNCKTTKESDIEVMKEKLKIIPLGGLNEIGKNMTVIEYGNDIVAVSYTHLRGRERRGCVPRHPHGCRTRR